MEDAGALVDQGLHPDAAPDAAMDAGDAASADAASDAAGDATTDVPLSDASADADAPVCATGYTGADCMDCASGYQDNDSDGVCTPACGSAGVCEATLGCDDSSGSAMCMACPLVPGARLAWTLDIPSRPNWNALGEIAYASDNRSSLASFAWTRVGYCMQLDSNATYVEMDDYTGGMLARVTLPMDWVYQQGVTNLSVRSTLSTVPDANYVDTGVIEMYSECYSEGADGIFNSEDEVGPSAHCYGAFQVHNDGATVIAWNGWSYVSGDSSVGMGNNTITPARQDWTDMYNVGIYSTRKLSAYVIP